MGRNQDSAKIERGKRSLVGLLAVILASWTGTIFLPAKGQDSENRFLLDWAQARDLAEANRLNQQVIWLYQEGGYRDAIPLAEKALQILEYWLDENHPDVATVLNNLAQLYYAQGNYSAAERLYLRSLTIYESRLGETHLDVAESLNNLAALYHAQGKYADAEQLFLRSLSILETVLGEEHPNVAVSLSNLAYLYSAQGNYPAAESLYLRSLDIRENVFGAIHPDVAHSLSGLASIYQSQGNYRESEGLYQRSISILETTLGESHPNFATSLNNLALLYHAQGDYGEAEALYWRSLSIREMVLGEAHPSVAISLNNLAELYRDQGDYPAAEILYKRVIAIQEAVLGEFHPAFATSLNNLALLYHAQGNYLEAERLSLQSLTVRESVLGKTHPHVAISLKSLAWFYQTRSQLSQSLEFLSRGMAIEESNLSLNLFTGSENRKRAYVSTLSSTTDWILSFHLQDAYTSPEAARLALTTLLRRKGRILDAVIDTQQLLRQNLSADLIPLLDDYTTTQSQLATRFYQGLGTQDPSIYSAEVDALQQQLEALENDLSRRSVDFQVATDPVEIDTIQALIPSDAVLIELVQYRPLDSAGTGNWGEPRYAAYVLHSTGDPQWVDLGDTAPIDEAAFIFLNATRNLQSRQVRSLARALDHLVMAPIRPLLDDATHLLLSPDGQLNLIPFAALVDEQDRYLVETYSLTHLTTGRDLLRLQNPVPSRHPPVILANPDYNNADTAGVDRVTVAAHGESQRSADLSTLRFGSLPGTEQELRAIAPLLNDPVILTEAEATENAIKQVQAPSILHIATHGFFLEDMEFVPPSGSIRASIGVLAPDGGGEPWHSLNRPASSENPLLRSGLALAGFNNRESIGEDGVLTALEAASLDLRGTRLVVMSACETGVGDVAIGEGVYGLRRAFVMAGAESQLMSLWKVDDFGTAELMRLYYKRLLAGEGRSEALQEIQRELLADPQYSHPYYWAAFLFSGQWQPIGEL
jgi:CHAT domain-containing protein/Flp pilus assembly protein TadD